MLFREVIGHETTKKRLIESYQAERTAHAQLFLGKPGNGALPLALAYAQYLLCEQPTSTDACGQCRACRQTSQYVHPDVHFSYPTVGSKAVSTDFIKVWRSALQDNPYLHMRDWLEHLGADNKQGNITKDECVSIVQRLSYKALEGRYKVLILWLPEYLGKEGNRLLKFIEEPRPKTVFLLVAEQSEKILNTILSRCQLVPLTRLTDADIAQQLQTEHALPTERAQRIAQLADGNYRYAVQLIDQEQDHHAPLLLYWIRVCYQGHPKGLVQWVEGINNGKHPEQAAIFVKMGRTEQVAYLQYALHFFEEFLRLQQGGGVLPIRLQGAELDTAQKMLGVLHWETIQQIKILLEETAYHIERNGNPRLLFLDLSIQLHHLMRRPKPVV